MNEKNSRFLISVWNQQNKFSTRKLNKSKYLLSKSPFFKKYTFYRNKKHNFAKHKSVAKQAHRHADITSCFDHRRRNSQQYVSSDSVASSSYASRKEIQNHKGDKHEFLQKRKKTVDVNMTEDQYDFHGNKNNKKQKINDGRENYTHLKDDKPISFKTLKCLVAKHPNEILLSISKKTCGFTVLIKQEIINSDLMAFLLIALGKACTASLNQNISYLLNTIYSSKNSLLLSIQKYLVSLRMNSVQDFHLESLMYLTIFMQIFQQALPSSSSQIISMLLPLLQSTCENLLKTKNSYGHVMERMQEIQKENEHFLSRYTPSEVKKASNKEAMQLRKPPENFRSIPVLPNDTDMHSNAFLRPNIVEGRYADTEHYLDVQYRLLREDYVKPLRDGIADYLMFKKAGKSAKTFQDVRVYENVHIVKQDFVNGGMVHIAQFSSRMFSKVKWEYSKRFLSGSLLCLSSNNFRTMLFASVAQRLPEQLQKGLLLIRFEEFSDEILNLDPQRQFVVLETSAYFEAYRHNLKALQELNEQSLPFKSYIVSVENSLQSPKYLHPDTVYDMRPLLIPMGEESYEYPTDVSPIYNSVPVLNDSCWPSASMLNLDDSQYQALKAAVTREFTLIQGPPGTGKTYVGLRIVQLLLHNIDKWFFNETNRLPILIVCFTNHALDQFLEGMRIFTSKIARIGGRGKNEVVSQFQLSNLKREAVRNKEIPRYISSSMWHKNHELKKLKKEIDSINLLILNSQNIIFGEEKLEDVIPIVHYNSLKNMLKHPSVVKYNLSDDGLLIHDWLGIRSRTGWKCHYPETFVWDEVKIPHASNNSWQESNHLHNIEENVSEADIEFIEAQRDIDSEEYANISFEIKEPEEKYLFLEDSSWCTSNRRKEQLKYIQNCLHCNQPLEEREAMKITNIWTLNMSKRWQLYKFWLERLVIHKQQERINKQLALKTQFKEFCEMRTEGDIFVLQKAHVLGMTTTGAAKYRDIVLRLNPQILIVEEAAEILESHVVTSLAPGTRHVILIGDHQQLQPSPTVHMLAMKYDLNISLFERMIKNKMDCFRLSIQHRMRPEVADLIVPHIYKDLKNHEIVTKYENIKGVSKNVFFVTHNYSELQESDSKSKINEHEARFLIKLCEYFVLQGYDPSQMTVLTTYSGQLFVMKKMITDVIQKVRFTVVDNFQGEENDIILISFVRSNEEGEIGFLKIANRVCVALSRAKKGLFCIGNFELLAEKSDLWKDIVNTLKEKQAIGPSLELVCQNHHDNTNMVSNAKDFESVPEGGCTTICGYRLDCGHSCPLVCHSYDRAHLNIHCYKLCRKSCEFGHKCPKKCFVKCGPCEQLVEKVISSCGHKIKIACHMQNSNIKCNAKCEKLLMCGHKCLNTCSTNCTVVCTEKMTINSPICGHTITVECNLKSNSEELIKFCKHHCNALLNCGHKCKGNCYRCHQGRFHVACCQPCKRILICGHECRAPCAKSCPPCKVPCENRCIHSKCPKRCGEPCSTCTEACSWNCKHQRCTLICGEMCDRVPCNKPCLKLLSCGHPCIGFCGEPCPSECRECDSEKVEEILFGTEDEDDARFIRLQDCNHILEVSGLNEWMKIDSQSDHQIQMKACPKCKTVIRTNLRFGNVVKDCLRKIENVKKITFGRVSDNKKKQKKLLEHIQQNSVALMRLKHGLVYEYWKKILSASRCRSIQEITTFENVFHISLQLAIIVKYLRTPTSSGDQDSSVKENLEALSKFMKCTNVWLVEFIHHGFFTASEQQLHELTWETHRLNLGMKLFELIKGRVLEMSSDFKNCISVLTKYSPFTENDVKLFSASYENVARACGSAVINLSELEKKSILKAMNLAKGHWYQCPNGHVYCITECGGAMEKGRCNECNEVIGGSNHDLLRSNRVATDMDGSRHSAWSDAMNMRNYDMGLDVNEQDNWIILDIEE